MRIEKILINNIGPFENKKIVFQDQWTGEIPSKVLLSGPNGCGKTTVLNCISVLWKALGHWLYEKKELPNTDPIKKYIGAKGSCAMVIDGLPDFSDPNSLVSRKVAISIAPTNLSRDHWFYDEFFSDNKVQDILHAGEWGEKSRLIFSISKKHEGNPETEENTEEKNHGLSEKFFSSWSDEYKSLILSGKEGHTPNIIYLDAEDRRWVHAQKNMEKPVQEDMSKRWLYKYEASANWNSQLEASLITLKITSLHKFHDMIRLLNSFLVNKEIKPEISPGQNRLRISIKNKRNTWHTFDQLSAGEREMMVLIYSIGRWMEKGGIVMVDEPDLFLHPGLMPDAFSAIEKLVAEKEGQLIVTSHSPDMWERYENRAMRIKLEPGAPL